MMNCGKLISITLLALTFATISYADKPAIHLFEQPELHQDDERIESFFPVMSLDKHPRRDQFFRQRFAHQLLQLDEASLYAKLQQTADNTSIIRWAVFTEWAGFYSVRITRSGNNFYYMLKKPAVRNQYSVTQAELPAEEFSHLSNLIESCEPQDQTVITPHRVLHGYEMVLEKFEQQQYGVVRRLSTKEAGCVGPINRWFIQTFAIQVRK